MVFGDQNTPPQDNWALLLKGGRIAAVGPLAELHRQYPSEPVVHHPEATILPGFIDMHIHLGVAGAANPHNIGDFEWALRAYAQLSKAFAVGVTTVRCVASKDGLGVALRTAGEAGLLQLPRLFTVNQGICMTGGHAHDSHGNAVECDGEWEIRKAIRQNFREGADWIKILTSRGKRGQEFTQEELNAAVDECHRMGRLCAAHAGYQPSVSMCIKAGFDTIEHGTFMTVEEAHIMREKGQTWVPTIMAFTYISDQIKAGQSYSRIPGSDEYFHLAAEQYAQDFKALYDTGVRTACGTDMVMWGAPAFPVAQELAYKVKYGITPLQAIETATKNGAEALRLGEQLGQLAPGYIADVQVVAGDPSADIADLLNVIEVYQEGELRYRR